MVSLFIQNLPILIDERLLQEKLVAKFAVFGSCSCYISTGRNVRDAMVEFSYSEDARRAFEALNKKSIHVSNHSWKLEISELMVGHKKGQNKKDTKKSEKEKDLTTDEKVEETHSLPPEKIEINNKYRIMMNSHKYFAKRTRPPDENSLRRDKKIKVDENQISTEKELEQNLNEDPGKNLEVETQIKNEYLFKDKDETKLSPKYSIDEVDINDPKYDL
jgi:hypothetical protein